ncbi:hypothetical protein QKU58_gp067 [Pyramimonas orientalis virus]|uniref:Tyrosine-protein kinase ephrin type A/B receptor-like domain-containing protein n=1 Tax=Pyramimonas orientalis virus 01B TaxID=3134525 RepID=A0A7M3UNK1_9VIRU|nr:hypothetical protein QKU58_gp067 [Pyramimonas orientalis virus]QOI90264.1 hypothetical protein HWQ62_00127 [Pyramimonas orientalis virus]
MLFYILFVVVISIGILLYIKSKNERKQKKHVEHFVNRTDMDDVLDYWCERNAPGGFDNYQGPWANDDYINKTNPRCGKHDCPTENCYYIERGPHHLNNPYEHYYHKKTEGMTWVDQENNDGMYCTSKHNIASNIHCEPNTIPHCTKHVTDIRTHYFNTTTNKWEVKYINYFMDNKGTCELRDVNYPYDIVSYIRTSDKSQIMGSPTTTVDGITISNKTVYNEPGPSCLLAYDSTAEKYYDDSDRSSYITMDNTKFNNYNPRTNAFVCISGNEKRYGHSNVVGKDDGFGCGWIDDIGAGCDACPIYKSECFLFDPDTRTYNKKNFLHIHLDADQNNTTDKVCDEYLVNDYMNGQFETLNVTNLDTQPNKVDSFLIDNNQATTRKEVNVSSGASGDGTLDACVDTLPDVCTSEDRWCYSLGVNVPSVGKDSYKFRESTQVPFDDKVIGMKYRRRWNSNGSACEYCLIDMDTNDCFDNSTVLTDMSGTACPAPYDIECPKGFVRKQDIENGAYCVKCGDTEYYNSTSKTCEPLLGCTVGQKFDPFTTINDVNGQEFHLYNYSTDTTIRDNTNGAITKDNFDKDSYAYLHNNLNTQCSPCDDVNSYMNNRDHVEFECNTCQFMDESGNINYVNNDKTECNRCVIANYEYSDDSYPKKRVMYSDRNNRTCETCPALDPNTDTQASLTTIASHTTDVEGVPGRCYRKCNSTQEVNHMRLTNPGSFKDYIEDVPAVINGDGSIATPAVPGHYEECEFECSENYYKSRGTCIPCAIGTQNTTNSATCTACPIGTFNSSEGSSCGQCPQGTGVLSTVRGSTTNTGSTNVTDCHIQCAGSSTTTVNYTTRNDYEIENCPSDNVCRLNGYTKDNLSSSQTNQTIGYKLVPAHGTNNLTVNPNVCNSPANTTVVNGCDAGFHSISDGNNRICCAQGLTYNSTTVSCDCPDVATYGNHVTEVSYQPGRGCVPTMCTNNVVPTNGTCVLTCNSDEYKNTSSFECIKCNLGSNVATIGVINQGTSQNDCRVTGCLEGYHLSANACIENLQECTYYEATNPVSTDSYVVDKTETLRGEAAEFPKYHERKNMSVTDCSTIQSSISACSSVDSIVNIADNLSACCENNKNFKTTNIVDIMQDGRKISREYVAIKALCCNTNTDIRISRDSDMNDHYGCCPSDQTLYVNGSHVQCCDTPSASQNHYLDDTGVCRVECQNGYFDASGTNSSECTPLASCPTSVIKVKTNRDIVGANANDDKYITSDGAYIAYRADVTNNDVTDSTYCEGNDADYDTHSQQTGTKRCIEANNTLNSDYVAYCCNEDGTYFGDDENSNFCGQSCPQYYYWVEDTTNTNSTIAIFNRTFNAPTHVRTNENCPSSTTSDPTKDGFSNVSITGNVATLYATVQKDCLVENENIDDHGKHYYNVSMDVQVDTLCPDSQVCSNGFITYGNSNACCEISAMELDDNNLCACPAIWTLSTDSNILKFTRPEPDIDACPTGITDFAEGDCEEDGTKCCPVGMNVKNIPATDGIYACECPVGMNITESPPGSGYTCGCPDGMVLSGDDTTCGCPVGMVLSAGDDNTCECPGGMVLSGDGYTCECTGNKSIQKDANGIATRCVCYTESIGTEDNGNMITYTASTGDSNCKEITTFENCVSTNTDSNIIYCCPSDSLPRSEGETYTCKPEDTEAKWTSNVRPFAFVGYDEDASVHHYIDGDLANVMYPTITQ